MALSIQANTLDFLLDIQNQKTDVNGKNGSGRNGLKGIFGNANDNINDKIELKRKTARKQAMKLIRDAWDNDDKTQQGISDMQDEKAEYVEQLKDMNVKIGDLRNSKEQLKEAYGIADDSTEQKDLELLEKYQDNINGVSYDDFTKDEIDRLKELSKSPLTEYQKESLKLNASIGSYKMQCRDTERRLIGMNMSITDAKIEQLKSQDMVKSKSAADELLDAAAKDVLASLIEQGRNNIDEKQKETEEAAEEAKKEKEELEERIQGQKDKAKEKEEQQKEIIKGDMDSDKIDIKSSADTQSVDNLADAQNRINKLLKDNNLINEDIKGIEIDLNF